MNVIIVEDNAETLGVLRDFVRATDPSIDVKTYTSATPLLDKTQLVQADLLILGYDLGTSVTGAELLHYLQWSNHISTKTHVIFLSNTIELARRQAPLRFTQTRFHEKPMSLGHLQEALNWARENQSVFSGVFYLIDKQRWQAAFNSLQLCKENIPTHLQQQAWLLECMLLLKLREYAKVIRRYQLIQSYEWAKVVKLSALINLGQLKASQHVFNGMAVHDAYYSSALALSNQLSLAAPASQPVFIPLSIKESELSLFESELKALSLVVSRNFNEAVGYLHSKQKRLRNDSHQAYFYAVAMLKVCLLEVLKEPYSTTAVAVLPQLTAALKTTQAHNRSRDIELTTKLWPQLLALLESGTPTAAQTTSVKVGPMVTDLSPISLLIRMYVHWMQTGELFINQVERCIELIEQQGASGRAVCNQLLLEYLLDVMLAKPAQKVRLSNSLASRLGKQGRFEQAAFALSRALVIHPSSAALRTKLALCCKRLEVKQFLEHA